MWEALVAGSIVVALATAGLVYRFVPWLSLLRGGAYLVAGGLLLSMMGGAVYHAMLYRALQPRGLLHRGWYWNPTALHGRLSPGARKWVLPWFYLGAAGFSVVMVGCVAVLISVLHLYP